MQNLARCVTWHFAFGEESVRARTLVARQAVLRPFHQIALHQHSAVMEHDHSVNPLAPFFIWETDYRDVLDLRMRTHQRFDLGWIDVLTARNDHVALAIGKMDVAFGITPGHISDGAVVTSKRFSGFLR